MMGAKKTGLGASGDARRSTQPPAAGASEARVKVAKKWSPTMPSVRAPAVPDPLQEAHAAVAEARAALDVLVLALDRLRRR